MSTRHLALAAAGLAGILCLAACGRQAALERPAPLSAQGAVQPSATAPADAAQRALADAAAAKADPRPPQSIEEVRALGSLRRGQTTDAVDPSAPRPPGSPPPDEAPASSGSQ